MILIESITVREVILDPLQLEHWSPVFDDRTPENIITEMIHGQRFTRPDGTRVCIGTSKQAADLIGIQYECWAKLQEANDQLRADLRTGVARYKSESKLHRDLQQSLKHVQQAPLWRRLLWVFTGVRGRS